MGLGTDPPTFLSGPDTRRAPRDYIRALPPRRRVQEHAQHENAALRITHHALRLEQRPWGDLVSVRLIAHVVKLKQAPHPQGKHLDDISPAPMVPTNARVGIPFTRSPLIVSNVAKRKEALGKDLAVTYAMARRETPSSLARASETHSRRTSTTSVSKSSSRSLL